MIPAWLNNHLNTPYARERIRLWRGARAMVKINPAKYRLVYERSLFREEHPFFIFQIITFYGKKTIYQTLAISPGERNQ